MVLLAGAQEGAGAVAVHAVHHQDERAGLAGHRDFNLKIDLQVWYVQIPVGRREDSQN